MLRHVEKKGKRAQDIRKNFTRWFEDERLAKRKASSISRTDAEKLHGTIANKRGEYAANRAVQLARAIYNKAKDWKLYQGDNPFSCLTLFDETPRERFLSAAEAGKLVKAVQELPDNDAPLRALRDFVLLDMLTGVRKSNLLSCCWDEIDFEAKTWTIPREKAKNRKAQVIALGADEIAILEARRKWLRAQGMISRFVFPSTSKRTSSSGHLTDLKGSWTTLRKRINLQDITIHDLRRSLAATMASLNVNLALIKSTLNHKDMKTTVNVYARTSKLAELEAKQLAHAVWFKAAESVPEENNVTPLVTRGSSGKKNKTKAGVD